MVFLHRWHVDSFSPLSAPSAGLLLLGSGMGFLKKKKKVNLSFTSGGSAIHRPINICKTCTAKGKVVYSVYKQ